MKITDQRYNGMFVTSDKNLTLEFVDGVGIGATGLSPITEQAWQEWVDALDDYYVKHGANPAIWQISPKQQPNVKQRNLLSAVQKKHDVAGKTKICIISTDSAVTRGAITSITWLMGGKPPLLAAATTDFAKALDAIERAIGSINRKQLTDSAIANAKAVSITLQPR